LITVHDINIKGVIILIKNIVIAISFIAITSLTYVNYFQVTSFESCLLKQMKGQSENLIQIAARLCRRDYPKTAT
jgi:hypothetical protein